MNSLNKQPSETFYVGIDFSTVPLATGETVVMSGGVNGTPTDSFARAWPYDPATGVGAEATDDVIVSGTLAVFDDTGLKVKVKAGAVADVFVKVSLGAVTSHGNFFERDLYLQMVD